MAHENDELVSKKCGGSPVPTEELPICEMCVELCAVLRYEPTECTRVPVGRGKILTEGILGCARAMLWSFYPHGARVRKVERLRDRKDYFRHEDYMEAYEWYVWCITQYRGYDHPVTAPVPPNPDDYTDTEYRIVLEQWRTQYRGRW